LIGFYGDSMQGLVPRYLEQALTTFGRQQQQMRVAMQQTMGNFFPFGIEEMGRQNMAMMERAMSLFTGPFYRPAETASEGEKPAGEVAPATPSPSLDDFRRLQAEIEALRVELAAKKTDTLAKAPEAGDDLLPEVTVVDR
jgi:polyhydroxyalkanoate synthesis regulator protein